MWDTKSHFKAQSSAWCVSGSGFLSTANSCLSSGFRETDPGIRRWQSLSDDGSLYGTCLSAEASPHSELRAALEEGSCRRAELMQRLRQAHKHLDTQTDLLKSRDRQVHQSIAAAHLLDMKHKQLAEAVSMMEHEKTASDLSQFEERRQRGRLKEKIIQLERDMMKVRSTLDKGSINQSVVESTASKCSRPLPVGRDGFHREEMYKPDQELSELRDPLRVAGERINKLEQERIIALQQLQTSKEAQKTLASELEDVKQKNSNTLQACAEVHEQLTEVQSKLGRACLEKEILSNQVLRLEDNMKDLKTTLSGALSESDSLKQEKADLCQKVKSLQLETQHKCKEVMDQCVESESYNNKQDLETKEELISMREMNKKLTSELEVALQKLNVSQTQLHELKVKQVVATTQINDPCAEQTHLIGETTNAFGHVDDDMTEICHKLGESSDALELENHKLLDRCLSLESAVLDKNVELQLKSEEYQKLEVERTQSMEELKAVASHWNEKWQDVALSLHSTQRELEELKQRDAGNKHRDADSLLAAEVQRLQEQRQRDVDEIKSLLQCKGNMEMELNKAKKPSDLLLRVELDACKQELELERSRSQALIHRSMGKGRGDETVLMLDKGTVTDMLPEMSSASNLFSEKPSDFNIPTDSSKACLQSSYVQRLEQELANTEKQLREKNNALKDVDKLRDTEKMDAHIRIYALEFKYDMNFMKLKEIVSGDTVADVVTSDELRAQQEESTRRAYLQGEEEQSRQTLKLYLGKDKEPILENRTDWSVCPVSIYQNDQRRMVAEQLKKLFEARKELGNIQKAVQNPECSQQDMESKSEVLKGQRHRLQEHIREWDFQQRGGLAPVSEEEEVEEDWPQGEEGEEKEVGQHNEALHNRIRQMTARTAERNLKEKR